MTIRIYTRNNREKDIQDLLDNKELLDFTNGRDYTKIQIAKVLFNWFKDNNGSTFHLTRLEHYMEQAQWYIDGTITTDIFR